MLHVPILRAGRPYRSLETVELHDVAGGAPVARVSQANPGLIARDLARSERNRRSLAAVPVADLLAACGRAARLFAEGELALDPDEGPVQSAAEYVRVLSATTGLPRSLCRANMEKIRFVLAEMETVLSGLTRGLDLAVLDAGLGAAGARRVSYVAEAATLGCVLPSNSPGVHALWLPAVPLKVPLALKPGRLEPWTPLRVARALIEAGCPEQAFSIYPTDTAGATEILLRSERSMIFGDVSTVEGWKSDPRVQVHGPGWSKVLFGADKIDEWPGHLDMLVESVASNGGRSCLNASGVWVPRHGREVALALAERLARIDARALDDPEAALAAFPDRAAAERLSASIDARLAAPGAEDLTARIRGGAGRVVQRSGCTFLLPTVIWCSDPDHPLAASEFLFPFVGVVEVPQDEMAARIGPTLVATAITNDERFREELLAARHVDRLNLGSIPTNRVAWDQPHEGNLFQHLYRQRALAVGA